jgi:hypothetical protein
MFFKNKLKKQMSVNSLILPLPPYFSSQTSSHRNWMPAAVAPPPAAPRGLHFASPNQGVLLQGQPPDHRASTSSTHGEFPAITKKFITTEISFVTDHY